MSGEGFVLGVDGGMTKTIALVADRDGRILGSARGVGANLYAGAPEECVATIASAAAEAASAAGVELGELVAGGLSLSGADCDEDIDYLSAEARTFQLGIRSRVVNDSIGALYAACPTGPGVVAVCGTGFTTGARSRSGQEWFGGHWTDWASSRGRGFLGGRAMAEAAVRAVVDEQLELGPTTDLTPRLLESFGVETVEELLHVVTARGVYHPWLRSDVTGQLLLAANAADRVALSIVRGFGAAMGSLTGVATRLAGACDEPLDLALMGSVLRAHCPALHDALLGAFAERVPEFAVIDATLEPAQGAVLIALELAGRSLTADVVECLERSSPPKQLFATAAGAPAASGEGS
jgi:N-acetylglucosamine kinase-like BadF-type ATPase